jgi:hypothetical protein
LDEQHQQEDPWLLCSGESVQVVVQPADYYAWLWSMGAAMPSTIYSAIKTKIFLDVDQHQLCM